MSILTIAQLLRFFLYARWKLDKLTWVDQRRERDSLLKDCRTRLYLEIILLYVASAVIFGRETRHD